jgi:hypothetical protein
MLRSIFAVVLGYVVLAVLVMLATAPLLLAPQLAFAPDSLEPTPLFTLWSLALSLAAAVVAGLVCALAAGRAPNRAVSILAGLVLVLGIALAAAQSRRPVAEHPPEAIAHMSVVERASLSREPAWYSFLLPFIGSGGVLLGGRLRVRHSVSSALA